MEKYELIAPCHFGLEAVLKREILDLGYEISKVEDGKVTFLADAQGIALFMWRGFQTPLLRPSSRNHGDGGQRGRNAPYLILSSFWCHTLSSR